MHEFAIIMALVLVNGFFAGAEIAVLSIRTARLAELQQGGGRRVRALTWLRADPERFLATVQVGITFVSAAAAAYGGASAPLLAAADAMHLDTSTLDIEAAVAAAIRLVADKRALL